MTKTYNDSYAKIRETIIEHMPKDAEITRIEFEGPRLAIYVKNVALLAEQSYVVTEIVNLLHKRIVVRSDQSIRLPEREAEVNIRKILPTEAEVESVKDRKSTRLNSSHRTISYAVFCLKKKKKI